MKPNIFSQKSIWFVAVVYGLCCWMLHDAVPMLCYCLILPEAGFMNMNLMFADKTLLQF